jgi:hypothetical protein
MHSNWTQRPVAIAIWLLSSMATYHYCTRTAWPSGQVHFVSNFQMRQKMNIFTNEPLYRSVYGLDIDWAQAIQCFTQTVNIFLLRYIEH